MHLCDTTCRFLIADACFVLTKCTDIRSAAVALNGGPGAILLSANSPELTGVGIWDKELLIALHLG